VKRKTHFLSIVLVETFKCLNCLFMYDGEASKEGKKINSGGGELEG
jgi:hypothetical protein